MKVFMGETIMYSSICNFSLAKSAVIKSGEIILWIPTSCLSLVLSEHNYFMNFQSNFQNVV